MQPAVALEGIFVRDDIRAQAGLPPAEGELDPASIWALDAKAGSPARANARRQAPPHALDSFKEVNPERWVDIVRATLNVVSPGCARNAPRLLIHEGKD